MNCAPATLEFYKYTVGKFLEWVESRGVTSPEEVTALYVRKYVAEQESWGIRLDAYMRGAKMLIPFGQSCLDLRLFPG